jgi:hypothetical protein
MEEEVREMLLPLQESEVHDDIFKKIIDGTKSRNRCVAEFFESS